MTTTGATEDQIEQAVQSRMRWVLALDPSDDVNAAEFRRYRVQHASTIRLTAPHLCPPSHRIITKAEQEVVDAVIRNHPTLLEVAEFLAAFGTPSSMRKRLVLTMETYGTDEDEPSGKAVKVIEIAALGEEADGE